MGVVFEFCVVVERRKKKFVIANKSIDTCPSHFPLRSTLGTIAESSELYHLQRLSVLHFSHFLQSMEPLVIVDIDLSWLYRAA